MNQEWPTKQETLDYNWNALGLLTYLESKDEMLHIPNKGRIVTVGTSKEVKINKNVRKVILKEPSENE
jgi:hypothetical protein